MVENPGHALATTDVSQGYADGATSFGTRRAHGRPGGALEHVGDAVARLGRALDVAVRLDAAPHLGALAGGHRARVARRHAGTLAQVGLRSDEDDRRPRTEVAHLGEPLQFDVGEAVAVVDREADDDHVGVGVRQRPKLLVVLLAGGVPQSKLNSLPVNLTAAQYGIVSLTAYNVHSRAVRSMANSVCVRASAL